MIRSCEDVKTVDNFEELVVVRIETIKIGLCETAEMLCWDKKYIICPILVETLFGWDPSRIADD